MELIFYAAWWGRDGVGIDAMVESVAESGYDGIETFVPADRRRRNALAKTIARSGLSCIAHQYEADGDAETCRRQLADNLRRAGDIAPVLVNSHTGRDHWPPARIDPLIEVAAGIESELGVPVVHETHRSRFAYSAAVTAGYLDRFPELRLTADLSHWACVSETLLEDQDDLLELSLARAAHTHIRVGSAQSAQVPDPAAQRWRRELDAHVGWWRRIRDHLAAAGTGR